MKQNRYFALAGGTPALPGCSILATCLLSLLMLGFSAGAQTVTPNFVVWQLLTNTVTLATNANMSTNITGARSFALPAVSEGGVTVGAQGGPTNSPTGTCTFTVSFVTSLDAANWTTTTLDAAVTVSGTNATTVGLTNFSDTVLQGARYIKPSKITLVSTNNLFWVSNIWASAKYPMNNRIAVTVGP